MNKRAFTLIELLVVVLIIGILAAIALPQYQTAVDRAHYSELMSIVKHVKDAQEVYYLANGEYAANCEELGVDLPGGTYLSAGCIYFSGEITQYVSCYHGKGTKARVAGITKRIDGTMSYEQFFDHGDMPGGVRYYASTNAGERGRRLVKTYCGTEATEIPTEQGNELACTIGYGEGWY